MKKDKKVLFFGANPEGGNRGVGALALGSLRCIVNALPEAKIVLLDYAKERKPFQFKHGGHSVFIDMINMRFSKKFYLRNNIALLLMGAVIIKLIPIKVVRNIIFLWLPSIKEISNYDVVFSISGGDSFSDIYGLQRFLYVSLPQLLVLTLRQKLILLPQTLGPFKSKMAKIIAKYIMINAHSVYSRDYTSLAEVKLVFDNENINKKLHFSYDMGFALEAREPQDFNLKHLISDGSRENLIGLNISGLLYRGGYSQDNQFGLSIDYPPFIYKLISWLIKEHNRRVLLIPHVFGSQLESDFTACKEIYKEQNKNFKDRLLFIDRGFGPDEIKYVIGCCNFFIGSRMHSCIAALSQGIPAIALAYSKKFYGVYQTVGVESLVVDLRTESEDKVFENIDRALYERERYAAKLKFKMNEVEERVMQASYEGMI